MTIHEILSCSGIKPDFKAEISSFLHLCEDLEDLTEQENKAILSDEFYSDRRAAYKKVVLLDRFEAQTVRIFKRAKAEAPDNFVLHTFLIKRVQDFQARLKINTGLHLHMLRTNPCYGGGDPVICH